ncbi:spore germination protein [Falsibacillus pallidus]|uniref:spore germination protein n=1 Tax=Falsibacillus pallidus TaxID=493781 RepID=UPI003D9A05C6
MQTVINIFSIKVNSVSNNGSINIGEALHNSPTANHKSQGQTTAYGDYAAPASAMENVYIDPDLNDQGDIMDNTPVISNQM